MTPLLVFEYICAIIGAPLALAAAVIFFCAVFGISFQYGKQDDEDDDEPETEPQGLKARWCFGFDHLGNNYVMPASMRGEFLEYVIMGDCAKLNLRFTPFRCDDIKDWTFEDPQPNNEDDPEETP